MHQHTYTADQLHALQQRGAQYLTVCQYSIGRHTSGDVLSWHRSHDAAQRAAKPLQYVAVVDLSEALFDAQCRAA